MDGHIKLLWSRLQQLFQEASPKNRMLFVMACGAFLDRAPFFYTVDKRLTGQQGKQLSELVVDLASGVMGVETSAEVTSERLQLIVDIVEGKLNGRAD